MCPIPGTLLLMFYVLLKFVCFAYNVNHKNHVNVLALYKIEMLYEKTKENWRSETKGKSLPYIKQKFRRET